MATHALGQGTCNLPINFKSAEKEYLGRLAFESEARSVGAYIRHLILRGLEAESPAAAERLRAIRNSASAVVMLLILAQACWVSWQPSADTEPMRGSRIVRILRGGRKMEEAV